MDIDVDIEIDIDVPLRKKIPRRQQQNNETHFISQRSMLISDAMELNKKIDNYVDR